MAKPAFWQSKELMRRNIRFSTKMKKVNAFEMGCYRRILKISWMDRVKHTEILRRLPTKYHFVEDMMKRKMKHLLRGSSGLSHLQILEGYVEGKEKLVH